MALDFLSSSTPATTSGASATQTTLPDWYNSYIQGIASKATDIASQPYQAYPGEQVADFNDDQQKAFQTVRDSQGNYQPMLDAAGNAITSGQATTGGALTDALNYGKTAVGSVSPTTANWTDPGVADKYMSPYTSSVVNEIGRLGNQNLTENIIPQTQSNFVGSGQFGSTRNATILGQAVRDAQLGITGQQSSALQAGYTGAEGQFNADRTAGQNQQQLEANTNLGAAQLANTTGATASTAGTNAATALGGLGSLQQKLTGNDATALGAVGGQEQSLEQTADNASLNNFNQQQNWDWTQLGKVQGAVQGAQLPTGSSTASNTSTAPAGTSPLAWLSALSGLYNSATSTPSP